MRNNFLTLLSLLGFGAVHGQTLVDNLTLSSYSNQTNIQALNSKTDPRGITEYYQYDGMRRLQTVLDHLNYVNKSFDYHYRPN